MDIFNLSIQIFYSFIEVIKSISLSSYIAFVSLPGIHSALTCAMAIKLGGPSLKRVELKVFIDAALLRKTSQLERVALILVAPVSVPIYMTFLISMTVFYLSYNGGIKLTRVIEKRINEPQKQG